MKTDFNGSTMQYQKNTDRDYGFSENTPQHHAPASSRDQVGSFLRARGTSRWAVTSGGTLLANLLA